MLAAVAAFLLLASPSPSAERMDYAIARFLDNGFTREEAEAFFRDPRLKVNPAPTGPPRKIDWDRIIRDLVAPASVEKGRYFLEHHNADFQEAERRFGVDKEIIAAILRVESRFGENTGRSVVFNAFYTALVRRQEEERWKWAADNLAALAVYCRTAGKDCFAVRGSYAGALGPAQFLPKSAELFGADGDGDGFVDPFNLTDAIFSAASFLLQHGWRDDQTAALGKYYGSARDYPRAVLAYAAALRP